MAFDLILYNKYNAWKKHKPAKFANRLPRNITDPFPYAQAKRFMRIEEFVELPFKDLCERVYPYSPSLYLKTSLLSRDFEVTRVMNLFGEYEVADCPDSRFYMYYDYIYSVHHTYGSVRLLNNSRYEYSKILVVSGRCSGQVWEDIPTDDSSRVLVPIIRNNRRLQFDDFMVENES